MHKIVKGIQNYCFGFLYFFLIYKAAISNKYNPLITASGAIIAILAISDTISCPSNNLYKIEAIISSLKIPLHILSFPYNI